MWNIVSRTSHEILDTARLALLSGGPGGAAPHRRVRGHGCLSGSFDRRFMAGETALVLSRSGSPRDRCLDLRDRSDRLDLSGSLALAAPGPALRRPAGAGAAVPDSQADYRVRRR